MFRTQLFSNTRMYRDCRQFAKNCLFLSSFCFLMIVCCYYIEMFLLYSAVAVCLIHGVQKWRWNIHSLLSFSFYIIYPSMSSTTICWTLAAFSVSWSFTQSVGLLAWEISQSQGRYLHTGQHKHRINTQTSILPVGFEPPICCSCNCICIVFIICSVLFIACVVLSAVFCLSVVCYFVWHVLVVCCVIVVPLPPGKNPFAVKISK
jgi:hypothetical protein